MVSNDSKSSNLEINAKNWGNYLLTHPKRFYPIISKSKGVAPKLNILLA